MATTAAELRDLVINGETLTVEFKVGSISSRDLVEAAVCLANGEGGQIVLGVNDDREIVGLNENESQRFSPVSVQAQIRDKTLPSVVTDCEMIGTEYGDVVVVNVEKASSVVATKTGKYLRRTLDVNGKPQCLAMAPNEVISRISTVGPQDYSLITLNGLDHSDLDSTELDRMRQLCATSGDISLANLSDRDLLGALNLISTNGELTIGSVLLFGAEQTIRALLPTHEVAFQEFDNNKVLANESWHIPLLKAMTILTDRIQARNREEEVDIETVRLALPQYGTETIRELVANALVHRDYSELGATLVAIRETGLTVSNPGSFPAGVNLNNFLSTPPRPRNPALADVFKRAGLVERTSRGINRAFAAQLRLGRPAPDYGLSSRTDVVAEVRSGPADRELAAYIAQSDPASMDLRDLLVLHEVRAHRSISIRRAAELFQVTESSAKSTLLTLLEEGLLDSRGNEFTMSASLYNELGEPIGYVRQKGFDPIQHEQMILTFVKEYGSIKRSEAAELCKISPTRASRILRSMRDTGKLALEGSNRASRYTLP